MPINRYTSGEVVIARTKKDLERVQNKITSTIKTIDSVAKSPLMSISLFFCFLSGAAISAVVLQGAVKSDVIVAFASISAISLIAFTCICIGQQREIDNVNKYKKDLELIKGKLTSAESLIENKENAPVELNQMLGKFPGISENYKNQLRDIILNVWSNEKTNEGWNNFQRYIDDASRQGPKIGCESIILLKGNSLVQEYKEALFPLVDISSIGANHESFIEEACAQNINKLLPKLSEDTKLSAVEMMKEIHGMVNSEYWSEVNKLFLAPRYQPSVDKLQFEIYKAIRTQYEEVKSLRDSILP